MSSHDHYIGHILEAIDAGGQVSQRSLAQDMGIALGLTNLLLKRLALRGLIRMARVKPHRVRYLLTPAGIAEKTRMSQRALESAVERYRAARARLESTFSAVSASFPPGTTDRAIVLYGTSEVAEIGFICLQDLDLRLVGVVDDCGRERFFGVPVYMSVEQALSGAPEGTRVVVATVTDRDVVRERLTAAGVRSDKVAWV